MNAPSIETSVATVSARLHFGMSLRGARPRSWRTVLDDGHVDARTGRDHLCRPTSAWMPGPAVQRSSRRWSSRNSRRFHQREADFDRRAVHSLLSRVRSRARKLRSCQPMRSLRPAYFVDAGLGRSRRRPATSSPEGYTGGSGHRAGVVARRRTEIQPRSTSDADDPVPPKPLVSWRWRWPASIAG